MKENVKTKKQHPKSIVIKKNINDEINTFFKKLFNTNNELIYDKYVDSYKDDLLKVNHLTKRYRKNLPPAIKDISFKVGHGEFHAFIGGNGAGKTTTIKSIVGAYAKYEGSIYISGWLNKTTQAKSHIGYIPEIAKFPEGMSSRNYLIQMALLSGVKKEDAISYADLTLKKFKMDKLAKKSPNTFSSGQKKKILLAQALVHNPELLIMDEPAANLDPTARIEFFDTIKQLQQEGKSIFISSHILSEVDKYATHATILDGGKIVFTGDLNKFKKVTSHEILLKTNDDELAKRILRDHNYEYTVLDDNNNTIQIQNIKDEDSKIILDMISKECNVILFEKFNPTLEDIYKKYVIKGSVHTMVDDNDDLPKNTSEIESSLPDKSTSEVS